MYGVQGGLALMKGVLHISGPGWRSSRGGHWI